MKIVLLITCLLGSMTIHAQNYENKKGYLQGKRIGVIGDSYVRNHREPISNTWHYKFAEKYGMQYFNYGRNGNCIAMSRARFGEAMYLRYAKEMADTLDIVLVIAGHNDAALLDSIGSIEIFKNRMSVLCEGLIERYPTATILFFTRWMCKDFEGSNSEKVVDAMIEVCGRYSIPIFDAARKSGIFAQNDRFRSLYFQNAGKGDTAHLNNDGHNRFLPVAEHFILQHLP